MAQREADSERVPLDCWEANSEAAARVGEKVAARAEVWAVGLEARAARSVAATKGDYTSHHKNTLGHQGRSLRTNTNKKSLKCQCAL